MKTKLFGMALACVLPAVATLAQNGNPPPQGGEGQRPPRREGGPGGPGGPGGEGQRPPTPPLMAALDANGDGTIDADEIANASAALKKLDKNGDGKLTPDEYRPARGNRGGGSVEPRTADDATVAGNETLARERR